MTLHHRPLQDFSIGYSAVTDDGVMIINGIIHTEDRSELLSVYSAVRGNANLNIGRYNRRNNTQFMVNTRKAGFISVVAPRYTITATNPLTNGQFNTLLDVYFNQR